MKVLAVGCHPDDLEIACGGTLRKYVEQGAEVYTCHVAKGDQGHVVIEPEELTGIRAAEFEEASRIIGAVQTFSLQLNDMEISSHDPVAMDAMADIVRSVRPDVIITHNDRDYMLDHTETSRIATNGSFCAGLSHRPRSYPPYSSFIPVFFMDTLAGVDFQPTHYVDITNQIETKLQALRCHRSQLDWMQEHDGIDFADMVRTCSKYRGYQCGVPYAEGFRPYTVYPRMPAKNLLP